MKQHPNAFISSIYILFLITPLRVSCDDASVMALLAKNIRPSGWSGSNPCRWTGVKCDASSHVTSISLINKKLSGILPAELGQLSYLQVLDFQHNLLKGEVPSLANISTLQEVTLDDNQFTSIGPNFFSGLTSLQRFSISQNEELQPWNLPMELAECTGLRSLSIYKAKLTGTIPDIFGSLPSLQYLELSYNNLTGSLPPSFAVSGIQTLMINNQAEDMGLTGRLDVLGLMSQLAQASVHVNAFSGPIPDLSNCTSLYNFQARDNQLTGVIPSSLMKLPKLVNVELGNNKLQGPFPEFSKGVNVSLGDTNNFCNSAPGPCDPQVTALLEVAGAVGYPMTLAESWEGNNACKDWNFVTCDSEGKYVTGVNFGKQHWYGTISPAIANLTSLRNLFLNDNNLTGVIPDSLKDLKDLQVLDISNNNLTGKVPAFSGKVKVNTAGNPLLGTDAQTNSTSGGDGSDGTGILPNTVSRGMIVAIIISSVILMILISLFFIRKYYFKFWSRGEKKLKNSKVDGANGYRGGAGTNNSSQPRSNTDDIQVYDPGNVSIPIEVLLDVTKNFSEDNIVGRGGFGVVYRGELFDGTQIAVKRMESNLVGTKGLSEFHAEIAVLTKVRHRHLVAFLGFCTNGNERLVVYEYMPQGTLAQHLFNCSANGHQPLTWNQRASIALDVARGVEYLHSLAQQSFIHRDLKPSNILLGDDMRAKVSDFGLVRNAPDGKYSVETRLAGTFGYLAPEYASTGRVTTKIDVFAFGVVLMELLTGRKALDESLPEDKSHLVSWFRRLIPNKINVKDALDPYLDLDDETFEDVWKIVELAGHCTAREPHQRPDIGHAVNVLAPLVERWKPTLDEEDDGFGIDLSLSLPQVLERWQANEGISRVSADFICGSIESKTRPSDFAGSFNSKEQQ